MNSSEYQKAWDKIVPDDNLNKKLIETIIKKRTRSQKPIYKRTVAIICCLILLLLGTTTALSMDFSINDLFKGYFKKMFDPALSEDYQRPNAANDNQILKTAGNAIYESTQDNGLKVTARGIVGDSSSIYMAIDVETLDGSPFSMEQNADINNYRFRKVFLQIEGTIGQYCSITRIDDAGEEGKATFLINEAINSNLDITGRNVKLTLSDLVKSNPGELIDIGMESDIATIMVEFITPSDEDYYSTSYRAINSEAFEKKQQLDAQYTSKEITGEEYTKQRNKMFDEGLLIRNYYLLKTKKQVAFSSLYPKLAINNIGIKDNDGLKVNFDFNDELTEGEMIDLNLVIYNTKTGDIISNTGTNFTSMLNEYKGNVDLVDIVDNKAISIHYDFQGVNSREQLKDAVFAFGGDSIFYETVREGTWQLSFDLDYKDTSIICELENSVHINNLKVMLDQITISPISLKLRYKTDDDFMNVKPGSYKTELLLHSGSRIAIDDYNIAQDKGEFTIQSILPQIVEIDNIKAIIINGKEIELNIDLILNLEDELER